MSFLFSNNQVKQKAISKQGCLMLLAQKKYSQVVWFYSTSIIQRLCFISWLNVWPFIFNVMLFVKRHIRARLMKRQIGTTIEQFDGILGDSVLI